MKPRDPSSTTSNVSRRGFLATASAAAVGGLTLAQGVARGAQGRQVRGRVPRPARLKCGALLANHRYGRFGRQARGLTPPIPVQNDVPQDENSLSGKPL